MIFISALIPFLLERNLQHTFSFLTCMQHLVFIVRKNSFFQTPFPVRLQTSFKEDILLTLLFLFLPWLFFSNIFHPLTYRRVIWLYHIFTFFFKYLLRKKIKKMLFFNFITMIFQFFSIKRHKKEKKKVWQLPTFPQKQYHRRKRAWLPCSVWERVLPLHYDHQTFYYWKHEDNPHATGYYAGDAGFSCLQS